MSGNVYLSNSNGNSNEKYLLLNKSLNGQIISPNKNETFEKIIVWSGANDEVKVTNSGEFAVKAYRDDYVTLFATIKENDSDIIGQAYLSAIVLSNDMNVKIDSLNNSYLCNLGPESRYSKSCP